MSPRNKTAELEGTTKTGKFVLPDGKEEIFGTLTFVGPDTYLRLDHDSFFDTPMDEYFDVAGEFLEDGRKASLVSCTTSLGLGRRSGQNIKLGYYAEIKPSMVMIGGQHISSKENVISKVYFQVDDAGRLFYDHRTFGSVIDAKPYISQIANANAEFQAKLDETKVKERILTGDTPLIAYFTGRTQIFSAETTLGTVFAENHPSYTTGSPEGVSIKNSIYVGIEFPEPVSLKECFWRAIALLRFLELCAGRPQNLLDIRLLTTKGEHDYLEVYWPGRPSRRIEGEIRDKPWAGEMLLEPVQRHDEYVQVLAQWLGRHKDWEEARMHFVTCMHDQRIFGPARITAAANMFDLLPPLVLPPVPQNKKFNPLKTNILHRAKIVTDNAPGRFLELEFVVDEAVKCRKRYVHARRGTIEYKDHFEVVVFLTETLEFLFAASDLIECGWSLKNWLDDRLGGRHPFYRYAHSYQRELDNLKKLIAQQKLSEGDGDNTV
ncbi:MAG: hypothetical protein ACRDRL_24480 [Sciscionella sp.]